MWTRWFPWRWVISRLARSKGFTDPVALLSRLHRFAQPSEVTEPIELLRAGVVFHARGLINTRAIQHNLDWVWPYWVERQFDPTDRSFVPRAFSITHVNLTHRNWTAVGLPDLDALPIVDPRGLLTPILDGWSLDAWIVPDDGPALTPSRLKSAQQRLLTGEGAAVATRSRRGAQRLLACAHVEATGDGPEVVLRARARDERPGWLVVSVRPSNPEGVALLHRIRRAGERELRVEKETSVRFDRAPDRLRFSDYRAGDVYIHMGRDEPERDGIECDVGLATAAAMFRLGDGGRASVEVRVPIGGKRDRPTAWSAAREGLASAVLPDARMQRLYDAALRTLTLHAPGDVYPGPYTYKRFWFRDAAFMLDAMLCVGMVDRVRRCVATYPGRQQAGGYFRSQEGEWDSNGEAIWTIDRQARLTGTPPSREQLESVRKGARWIERKRCAPGSDALHAGLMPAGFSAEHLGPNDYYYWDDFWSVAGLESAARLLREAGERDDAERCEREAIDLRDAIDRSIERSAGRRARAGVPASPYRRMDPGAIGSIACGYPLRLWEASDPRMLATARFLMDECSVRGGFFQDMIHSGINAYLTLHLAQVLLRAGDPGAFGLVETVAGLASPTGQWPEAIHPLTLGGCMGDGQHAWAAAEWALMIRNMFVREEGEGLVLASGIPPAWVARGGPIRFGPTLTPFGAVSVEVGASGDGQAEVRWEADWRDEAPALRAGLLGEALEGVDASAGRATVPANGVVAHPKKGSG